MSKIGIITRPSNDKSFAEPVYRFATIVEPCSSSLSLFTGGIVARESPLSTIINVGDGEYLGIAPVDYAIFQVILSYHIIKHWDDLDLIYFHKGSMGLVLPVLFGPNSRDTDLRNQDRRLP